MGEPDEKKPLSCSFPKSSRILKREDFLRLSRPGRKIRTDHFLAIVGAGRFANARIGITVTRKVGHAVTRNRIRRHVREFFRKNRHRIEKNLDINIIAHTSAARLTSAEVAISLEQIFKNICRT